MKTKRIKKVFSNHQQVIHLWANQSQDGARSKNVFFDGKSIYSYGRHYELGRLIEYNGVTVALINDRGYSVTTSRHIYRAFQAVSHLPRLKLDFSMASIATERELIFKGLISEQDRLIKNLMSYFFIKKDYWGGIADYTKESIVKFNKNCDLLNFKDLKIDLDSELFPIINERIKEIKQKMAIDSLPENVAKREKEKQEKLAIKFKEQMQAWREGGQIGFRTRLALLRVKNGKVQTSHGASVPLNEAIRLLSAINKREAKSGDQIGPFKFIEVNEGIVKIGCHQIELKEAMEVLGGSIQNDRE